MDERTDKLNTKKDPGQQLADHCDNSENKLTEGPDISRRKFTRNVLVGSAVLLTLTNRGAWGSTVTPCVSTNLLTSVTANASMLTQHQETELSKYNQYLNDPDNWTVIKQPEDIDGVTCYKAVSNNGNNNDTDTTTETLLLFEPDKTNK